jgi:hypothetical protein
LRPLSPLAIRAVHDRSWIVPDQLGAEPTHFDPAVRTTWRLQVLCSSLETVNHYSSPTKAEQQSVGGANTNKCLGRSFKSRRCVQSATALALLSRVARDPRLIRTRQLKLRIGWPIRSEPRSVAWSPASWPPDAPKLLSWR